MAVRGHPLVMLTNQATALFAPVRQHSRKPDEFYALIETLCPGNKLDIFGREQREGWLKKAEVCARIVELRQLVCNKTTETPAIGSNRAGSATYSDSRPVGQTS